MSSQKAERMAYFRALINKELPEQVPPFTRWLGGILKEVNDGELTAEFSVRIDMANPLGVLHGGAHTAIMDDLIGMTVYTLGHDQPYVSVNLTIDFLGPARIGDKVIAKAKVVREGKQIINATCELFDTNGNLISRGSSNMVRITLPIGKRQ